VPFGGGAKVARLSSNRPIMGSHCGLVSAPWTKASGAAGFQTSSDFGISRFRRRLPVFDIGLGELAAMQAPTRSRALHRGPGIDRKPPRVPVSSISIVATGAFVLEKHREIQSRLAPLSFCQNISVVAHRRLLSFVRRRLVAPISSALRAVYGWPLRRGPRLWAARSEDPVIGPGRCWEDAAATIIRRA